MRQHATILCEFLRHVFIQLKIHFIWKILLGFILLLLFYIFQRYMSEDFNNLVNEFMISYTTSYLSYQV